MLLLRDLFSSAIPRQVEKFWTRTDWEIFLGGIWGGLLTSTENLENFGNSWGGQGPNWGGTDFPKFFWGGGASLVILGVLPRYAIFSFRKSKFL